MRISDWSSDVCSSDLLDCWQDSNGPYHDERMLPSCAIHQGDWPALQKPNEIVLPVQRGETQSADRHHACTNLVCRPLLANKNKGGVQQRFHGTIALRGDGCSVRQFLRLHGTTGS